MEIKLINVRSLIRKRLLLMIMRTFIFLLCTTVFSFHTESSLAQEKVTIDVDKVATIDEVFEIIIDQTKFRFLYPEGLFKDSPKVQLKKGIIRVDKLLNQSLGAGKFNVIVSENNTIIIKDSNFQEPIQVVGKVVDESGLPVSGATVLVKGTTRGVATDFDGSYTILVPNRENILMFSALGFATQEVIVGNQTNINIVLIEEAGQLGEVVINAGYYSTTDREKTGSISRVTAKEIERQPINNPLEALQGRVPGLDIVQTTGLPGGGYTVRIRGQNSIAAGNDPLYIVDGVPYNSSSLGNQSLSGLILPAANINPLNTLDPASIHSVEILKDADATAIYGSRGANGVILITTKKGKSGKTTLGIEVSTTLISVTKMRELLNTQQYIDMREEAYSNDGNTVFPQDAYDINGTWDLNRYTDWQKEFIGNTGINNNVKMNVSGGNEQTQFVLMGGFMKETTVLPFDFNYKRTTVFTSTTHESKNKRFHIQFSANYGLDSNYLPNADLTPKALLLSPNAPELYDGQGNLNFENSTWNNPYADLESIYNNSAHNLTASTAISYKILKAWSLKTNLGYTNNNLAETKANPSTRFNPAYGVTSASSSYFINDSKRDAFIVEPQLDGKFNLGKGEVKLTIGGTIQEQNSEQMAYYGYGYASDQLLTNISAAQNVFYLNNTKTQYHYLAAYARLNYNYDHKYIINLTGRRDGSSRFGPDNRFANFGALGLAWLFSQEQFLQESSWLSFGKLRASVGTTGNDQIGDYQFLDTYSVTDDLYNGGIGLVPTRLFNPNYAWERNRKFEIGLEMAFIKDRLQLEAAYYNNRSDNQLVGIPLPATTGFSSINANLDAVVDNYGLEIGLNTKNVMGQNFQWETSFQLSVPKTKLKEFKNLESSTYANYLVIGAPMNIYKLYEYKGVNPETGSFEFEDFNGDGSITGTDDREYVADVTPKYYGIITNSLQYKNMSLDLSFQFVNKKGLNEFYGAPVAGVMVNQPTGVLDHWQNPGDDATYQMYTAGGNYDTFVDHTRFTNSNGAISDASFIRLKTLALSYRLPIKGTVKTLIYLQAQNLLTLTRFKGGDPEQTQRFLPPVKRMAIGLKVEL